MMAPEIAGVPPLNEKLLNCVLEHIEREVERGSYKYNQNEWAVIDWDLVEQADHEGEESEIDQTMCGTSGCVAGWACMLSTPLGEWSKVMHGDTPYSYHMQGEKKLGLTRPESEYLFSGSHRVRTARTQFEQIKGRVRVIRESRANGWSNPALHPDFYVYKD